MSELQTKTDAEPTPGPWRLPSPEDAVVLRDFGVVLADLSDSKEAAIVAEANQAFNDETELEGHYEANARLIAAAGTAAQEAREMGYDPAKTVGQTGQLLCHLEKLIACLEEAHEKAHPEGHMQGGRYDLAVDGAKNTLDALASAEGGEE